MGCGASVQTAKSTSQASVKAPKHKNGASEQLRSNSAKEIHPMTGKQEENKENKSPDTNNSLERIQSPRSKSAGVNSGIAFDVMIGDGISRKPPPRRLSRLEPIDAPRLTAEELEEKLLLAERKRNSALETRAKTASESRRQSKRKRELMIARELERQHQQAKELEDKLKSAEKQRELQNHQKTERQKMQEERIARARKKREKLQADDVISDVEQDDNFNNDDVDSWLEGSNNDTNTVDTGFSSATSERIYSGRESPKKKLQQNLMNSRSSILNSASTVDSCDIHTYKVKPSLKQSHHNNSSAYDEEDEFFDS